MLADCRELPVARQEGTNSVLGVPAAPRSPHPSRAPTQLYDFLRVSHLKCLMSKCTSRYSERRAGCYRPLVTPQTTWKGREQHMYVFTIVWVFVRESQMQPAHCSPLKSATNAPWAVSKWFGRPLRHLSPGVSKRTTSADTRSPSVGRSQNLCIWHLFHLKTHSEEKLCFWCLLHVLIAFF